MLDLFSVISGYLLGQGIQIAAIFGVVWVMCFLLKRKSAHLRYLLWLLVIAKCIFPSVMKVSLAVLPEKEAAVVVAEVIEEEPPAAAASIAVEFENMVYDEPVFAEASFFDRLKDINILSWFGIVWSGGVVLFFAGVCFKAWRLNRKLRLMRREADIDGDDTIKVWQIDGIGQPFVWGVLKGSVYVPGNFDECGSAEDRRGILMHEFAHVRRFDAGVNVLQIIAQGIFWFHPLVWVANTMIRREREKCCDEAAIAGIKTLPRDYGKAIIDTLTREYESNMPVGSLAIAGPVKNIEDRIKTIMRPGKKFHRRCGIFAMITVILLAAIALPTGCVLTSRTNKYDESLMEVRDYELAVMKYDSEKDMKDDRSAYKEMISRKAFQVPVDHISNMIFPPVEVGSAHISELYSISEGHTGKPDPSLKYVMFAKLEVKHVPAVHKKVKRYVEKYNKKFCSKIDISKNWPELAKRFQEEAKEAAEAKMASEKPKDELKESPIMFHGLDLSKVAVYMKVSELPEVFKERPDVSGGYRVRDEVYEMIYRGRDGMVLEIPSKNIFYVQHNQPDSGTKYYYGPFEGNPRKILKDVPPSMEWQMFRDLDLPDHYLETAMKAGTRTYVNESDLGDLFEEDPKVSWKYRTRKEVIVFHKYYYVPSKNVFYQRKPSSMGFAGHTYFGPLPGDPRKMAFPKEKPVKTQVLIESRFIEAGPDFLEELGIDVTIHAGDKIPHPKPLLDNETGIINPANSECSDKVLFDNIRRDFILNATRRHPQAKILANSSILVHDTKTAMVKTMSKAYYISGYEEDPNNLGQFNEIIESLENGMRLELIPTLVNNSSDVDLRFDFESKQLIKFTDAVHESGKIFQLPAQMTTEMSSRVIIPNGKTYLTVTHKLPNSSTELNTERYMILLMSPEIIKPAKVE